MFNEKANEKKNIVKAGLFGAASMGLIIAVSQFTPEFGPAFDFSWWASLLTGGTLWVILFMMKKLDIGFR